MKKIILTLFLAISILSSGIAQENPTVEFEIQRNQAYSDQLENYLRDYLVNQYDDRADKAWNRDYSSTEAFQRSVEPNRRRWEIEVIKPPVLRKTGLVTRKPYTIENVSGEWLELPLGDLTAQAFLALPEGASQSKPVALVLVQHGIGSTPETPFRGGNYHEYAKGLLKAGFAVLVPMNLRTVDSRNRIERLASLAGMSLPGIELARVQNMLDLVLADPRIDPDRVGMWGVSLGGLATMFWMPLEPRIKAGIVSAWFNHRRNKMAVPDSRYSCFLETEEDHAFFNAWLTEFTDSDVACLICPRPLQIQHGKKDGIAYWPQVVEEFEATKEHYRKLGIEDRTSIVLHKGGHEAIVEEGIAFLTKWLR